DVLGTISDYTAGRISPALSRRARERVVRLPPPVDLDRFRPDPAASAARPRAIAVGRLVRQKGFDTLLRAWTLVQKDWPVSTRRPELVIVGDGPRRTHLESMLNRLDLNSTVRLVGRMSRSAVIAELQAAHVFVLPVRTRLGGLNPEGLGLAAIEAAACALPVIVGRSGGAPETVLDGGSGFVVEPTDEREVAARLRSLLLAPATAQRMGARGRVHVREKFGSERVGQTLREALDVI
ncbi:MAG: glycosyltransferase family 4 protein, partial [Propionibacteriaceae bacterium]